MPALTQDSPLVLLVDDVEDNRDLYEQYLRFSGYRVATASTGFDALAKAVALRPDVIIMDMGMPVLDGWETTRRLKADPVTAHVPVIALTGHVFEDARKRSAEAGCTGFLTKPCLPNDLIGEVKRHTAGR